jgi:hypothetical protein
MAPENAFRPAMDLLPGPAVSRMDKKDGGAGYARRLCCKVGWAGRLAKRIGWVGRFLRFRGALQVPSVWDAAV